MEWGQQLLSVVFVLALLGGALVVLRRKVNWPVRMLPLRGARDRRLQSTGRIPLTPQHALHLVQYAGKELLIATHPQGCSLLTTGASPEREGVPAPSPGISAVTGTGIGI